MSIFAKQIQYIYTHNNYINKSKRYPHCGKIIYYELNVSTSILSKRIPKSILQLLQGNYLKYVSWWPGNPIRNNNFFGLIAAGGPHWTNWGAVGEKLNLWGSIGKNGYKAYTYINEKYVASFSCFTHLSTLLRDQLPSTSIGIYY